jgi:lipoate-protein ligase B
VVAGIVPCGVSEPRYGVTSLADLGLTATMDDVDAALRREFEALFGATVDYSVGRTEKRMPDLPGVSSSGAPSR